MQTERIPLRAWSSMAPAISMAQPTLGALTTDGSVFELTPNGGGRWTEKVLHSFNNNGADGIEPFDGLILDGAGSLYGTTLIGGVNNSGVVFELSPNGGGGWTEAV